jgi:hypothetical protein
LLFLCIIVVSGLYVGVDVTTSTVRDAASADETVDRSSLDGMTMVSSQSEGLFFLSEDGSVAARLTDEDAYFDADRVREAGTHTILYTAANYIAETDCGFSSECIQNRVATYNVSTGEKRVLFSMVTKRYSSEQWHDADYLGPDRVVVADIAHDRVIVANTSTGLITWEWQAHQAFGPSSGGRTAEDWTHLNDVEVLPDGRIMVSLRNHDQVVFLDRDDGMNRSLTLGRDHEPAADNRTLYEQHNPDYIPPKHGGPAVVVADSEHNRVVEFQRTRSGWEQSWEYEQALNWPRDADRLPNGNTLIADSRDNEVLEIDRSGQVVWQASVPLSYEAERLGSGPESEGGPSAERAGLQSVAGESSQAPLLVAAKNYLPDRVVNGLSFVLAEYRLSLVSVFLLVVLSVTLLLWGVLEWRWSAYRLRVPVTER